MDEEILSSHSETGCAGSTGAEGINYPTISDIAKVKVTRVDKTKFKGTYYSGWFSPSYEITVSINGYPDTDEQELDSLLTVAKYLNLICFVYARPQGFFYLDVPVKLIYPV